MKKAILASFFVPALILFILNITFFRVQGLASTGLYFWYYFPLMLSFLFFPISARLFKFAPDYGYGINRFLSIFFVVFVNWFATFFGIFGNTQPGLFLSLLIVVFLTHTPLNGGNDLIQIMKEKYKEVIVTECLFLVSFLVFLFVFSLHPDLFWGEKPMDFNLLNFGFREISLPWQDPWYSGENLKYYYFGYYFFSSLIKLTGVGPEVGYSLSLVTGAALFTTSLFSLFYFLLKRMTISVLGALTLTFASNLQAFILLFAKITNIDARYFWNITRIFKNNYFAEFPSWSFLFADLHPHVMTYMTCIVFLFMIFYYFRNLKSLDIFFYFAMAFVWGSLIAFNSWDFIIYSVVFGVMLLSKIFLQKSKESIYQYFLKPLLISLTGLLLFSPFLYSIRGGRSLSITFNEKLFHDFTEIYLHHGHWWLIVLLMWVPLLVTRRKTLVKPVLLASDGLHLLLGTIVIFIFSYFFVLFDYLNTTFKFFNQLYVLWGILAFLSLRNFRYYLYHKKTIVICAITIFLLNAVWIGGVIQAVAVTEYRPLRSLKSTLYGTEYLSKTKPEHYKIIRWLNKNVVGTPGIVETYSKSFNNSGSLISTHTGLPSFLGWDNHVKTRGIKLSNILERKRLIDFIYNSTDPIKVHELLVKEGIKFVIVTPLEQARYKNRSLKKFERYQDLFTKLYFGNQSAIYGVGNFKNFLR